MRGIRGVMVVAAAVGLFAAACGGGGTNAVSSGAKPKKVTTTTSPAPASTTTQGPVSVMLADSMYGKILVDANGMTLYEHDGDSATNVTCTGGCATVWPTLTVTGTPSVGAGLDASKLATVNGTQVVYGGHPLYRFASDQTAGAVTGQGVGGFFVLGADGQKITSAPSATTTPATTPPATMGSGY
jgi:predicted lipoprotein with Yx(FWY)xxD motif